MDIESLLQDESFAKRIDEANNLEEVAQLFKEKGIEVSASDIQKAMDSANNEELTEDNLENVAGGLVTPILAGAVIGAYLVGRWWKRNSKTFIV